MKTMEITKFVGAICGSLLFFLLLMFFTNFIFDTHSEEQAFLVELPDPTGAEAAPVEEIDVAALVSVADADKGATVFRKCAACHKLDGSNGVGPHLDGLIDRPVAGVEGFAYSDAMGSHGGNWTAEEIFDFLGNPKAEVPGTKMTFAGLPKVEDRANVIAYLESLNQ